MVETLFSFHPLVWWIGARLVEQRERACDEEVLSPGSAADVYADAILNVCKRYVESGQNRALDLIQPYRLDRLFDIHPDDDRPGEVFFARSSVSSAR
jgi:hypothetical protein